ncbi:MAG TPA: hypothetical protein PLU54_11645, partial [Deltaproteobacteria bacterium]|nr:hypothetical protein [Deltaproteobacteria bacterium]
MSGCPHQARRRPGRPRALVHDRGEGGSTPLTNRQFTGNTRGAIYGLEQSMDNSYMTRIDNRTPIDGFCLASAWGNPGGGFTGALMSGQLTFLQMMEDWAGNYRTERAFGLPI